MVGEYIEKMQTQQEFSLLNRRAQKLQNVPLKFEMISTEGKHCGTQSVKPLEIPLFTANVINLNFFMFFPGSSPHAFAFRGQPTLPRRPTPAFAPIKSPRHVHKIPIS
jgi:hypothetical protein